MPLTRKQVVIGLLFHYVFIAIVAHAQNYSSCEPLQQYVDEHPGCYIYYNYYDEICYGMRCSGSGPNGSNITYLYTRFNVQRCQDPVTVSTYAYMYQNGRYHGFSYTFDQSETVDNLDYYYYYYYDSYDDVSYTAILDRNASHLGFEVLNMMCSAKISMLHDLPFFMEFHFLCNRHSPRPNHFANIFTVIG